MLLDCGEGSYGQLRRRYGAGADDVIACLRCIWISHIHADHHAGLSRSADPPLRRPPCPLPAAASLLNLRLAPPPPRRMSEARPGAA